MGAICLASSSLCSSKLRPFGGSSYPIPALFFNVLPVFHSRTSLLSPRNFGSNAYTSNGFCGSFCGSFEGRLNSGGHCNRKGKKRRWNPASVGNGGSDFPRGKVSDKEGSEVLTIREEEGEKEGFFSTEASEDSSARSGRSVWDFLKLQREKFPPQPVMEKRTGLDGEKIEIQWRNILDPTPENLLALLLTGLLGFAVLRIFWQLLVVAITIIVAAFKYSVIAAILIALLVFFL